MIHRVCVLNESETQSDFRSYIEKLSTIDHGSRF